MTHREPRPVSDLKIPATSSSRVYRPDRWAASAQRAGWPPVWWRWKLRLASNRRDIGSSRATSPVESETSYTGRLVTSSSAEHSDPDFKSSTRLIRIRPITTDLRFRSGRSKRQRPGESTGALGPSILIPHPTTGLSPQSDGKISCCCYHGCRSFGHRGTRSRR